MATTATERFTLADYLIGIEGLAILRASFAGDYAAILRRKAEIQRIVANAGAQPYSQRRDLPPGTIEQGYAVWSQTYDPPSADDDDPIIQTEQPVVRSLIDELPRGRVLDAACGTGRHTAYLVESGHDVVGTDCVPEMLDKARAKLPGVEFHLADLERLPFDDARFDAVVCGLALLHLEDVVPAVGELARVVRSGGRVIASVPHPFIYTVLGWRAPVFDDQGNGMVLPEYGHLHSAYITAFSAAGCTVRRCLEPTLSAEQARWNPAGHATPEDEALEQALMGQPAALVWEVERT
jgi:ubiquinone/menaquinone biosynthesis C-methylase UbiE